MSKQIYKDEYVKDIEYTVRKAAQNFGIKNYIFETVVKTEHDRLVYCTFKMSDKIYKFFCNAYGGLQMLEKDYQVTEHK